MKYKVGDRVRIKSLDWYNENKDKRGNISFPYEVEVVFTLDKSSYCGQVVTISKTGYTQGVGFYRIKEDYGVHMWTDEMIEGLVEEETKNNNDTEEKETLLGWVKENDSLRLVPHKDYEIKHDGDNFYLVKKKKEYPRTYKECCEILGLNSEITDSELLFYFPLKCGDYTTIRLPEMEKFEKFIQLYLCRNAYWKIAGEEMGLSKPWSPSDNNKKPIHAITHYDGYIIKDESGGNDEVLEFPTEEMRDAFYENFKAEIEQCKELL